MPETLTPPRGHRISLNRSWSFGRLGGDSGAGDWPGSALFSFWSSSWPGLWSPLGLVFHDSLRRPQRRGWGPSPRNHSPWQLGSSALSGAAGSEPVNLLYVVDASQHRVIVRLASGQFYDVAGDGSSGLSGDGGPAVRAQLSVSRTLHSLRMEISTLPTVGGFVRSMGTGSSMPWSGTGSQAVAFCRARRAVGSPWHRAGDCLQSEWAALYRARHARSCECPPRACWSPSRR